MMGCWAIALLSTASEVLHHFMHCSHLACLLWMHECTDIQMHKHADKHPDVQTDP